MSFVCFCCFVLSFAGAVQHHSAKDCSHLCSSESGVCLLDLGNLNQSKFSLFGFESADIASCVVQLYKRDSGPSQKPGKILLVAIAVTSVLLCAFGSFPKSHPGIAI